MGVVAGVPDASQALAPPHLPAAGLHRGHQAGGLLLVAADSNITHFLMTPSAVRILTESSLCLQIEAAPRKVRNDMEMQHLT